ncbi:ShlB/FhaC/HecB family hemolysin secretion/activation protein [Ideonella sp. B7]|uniref:ShlB/FhaC/HecB family hemolysin secretion/activation protein n=1 Tax=Ideonella benzenivorans TaxID=2831643 RepID=UPI001CED57BE|nr:ShlB/FhaC/HecB family hemolysin secretion/activation protein [Ideonella benzenivorans]MCA6215647.1 ShlB/FhaC/HecB family hemolysin secretion/activation protein [Ideonella benzenivorans]
MKLQRIKRLRMASALLGLSPLLVLAAPPDAGQLLNERQRVETPPRQHAAEPGLEAAPAATPAGPGLSALVSRVRFTGAEDLATEAELQSWVADALGQRLNHGQLQALAARVTARLQAKGYLLARAYLPRQDLSGGELQIAVLAGRLQEGPGRLTLNGGDEALQARLRAIADANLHDGPARAEDVERALLLMRDVPGISVRSALDKGEQPGTSRIQTQVQTQRPWGLGASVDNFTNRYTGSVRVGVHGSWFRPLEHEDVADLSLSETSRTHQAALSYAWGVLPEGLRANVNASYMHYRVGLDLAPLDLTGTARTLGAGLSYPLIRGRERNLWATLDAADTRLDDDTLGVALHRRVVDSATLGLSGNHYDELGGGGSFDFGAGITSGTVGLSGNADDNEADRLGAGTQGSYQKLSWRLARTQTLPGLADWSVLLAANGQFATANLDSSEKFILGGPSGVRAYPVGEASGDEGTLLNLELRRDVRAFDLRGQALVFFDAGWVTQHHNLWSGALPEGQANRYTLTGAGLGFNLAGERWNLRSAWAHVIGRNPGRSATGLDADGRAARSRAWVQLNVAY